ncbi:hypothetical protein AtNW77_Chr4g0300761 [Arabidopsis thaliana]|uniref:Uncharacterized protein n=3 Tax=Arabidopsis TaxID=3701 RepID=A0A384KTH6_ARATH|nr:uncharacterized protein AT4G23780 [Arabidopsis thaliana]NP_001328973.1 uncharacterized protein AT4G23780 [Arabidopsis thaliana]KAG7617080.1 hypothetical protein ISN45_At04g024980 [Arabidopsis thaliana x Arabidopsis arenosa]AEE84805.2 hypothetical protein AT4G23780 [Arabidopsis thaliana]ANM67124.1 hypothetical protein AT4G23780 [Arabidopsis thaliana]OAO99584.1 hypothetical protein AXX17_AT4G27540 [Arabidopsis thaliana]CAA0396284.1 unnamed protein product [Arabidopsis thaliana]|eukprot:NP_001320051.1 hypothetical protein AT4G23780 [Arabidopsis thaliana]
MSSLGNQSEKNSNNKFSDNVPLAQHEIWKEKYESLVTEHENLVKEHETLIKTLELIEKHEITLEDLVKKKQREALVGKEEIEKFDKEIGERKKMQEMLDKDLEYLKSCEETVMNGMSSGPSGARVADKRNVNKFESQEDVIEISDDDERTQSESNVGNCNSSHKNLEYSFIL